ncbi:MAG: glycosyltransferase family 2 protein [Desulfurococcales archaeon]|nr:glycosyltransferase family 2 protein [Desulfurococcales archaeon]
MTEKSNCNLSVVIPTYNEKENIKLLLPRIIEVLEDYSCKDFEIIIVDDNSPDGTSDIVKELSNEDNRIKLIVRTNEKGLATAVKEGLKQATRKYVIVMDADFQHPPELIPELYQTALEGYDIVVASRYIRGGGVEGWSVIRLLASKAGCLIARMLVRGARGVRDNMSGYFIVRKSSIDIDRLNPRGYKILLEILGRHRDIKITEIPYIFKNRLAGESKISTNTLVNFLVHIFNVSEPLKFAAVGASGVLVNLGIMWFFLYYGLSKELSSLAGIEASIISNFLLNDSFTFQGREEKKYGFLARLLFYHLSSSVSAITTFLTMLLTTEYLGIHPVLGQFIGILLGFAANYLLSSRVIWLEKP